MVTSQDIKVFIAEEIMEIKARSRKPDSGGVGFLFYDESSGPFDEEGRFNNKNDSAVCYNQSTEVGYSGYFASNANKNPFEHGMDKAEIANKSSEKSMKDFTAEEIAEIEARYS